MDEMPTFEDLLLLVSRKMLVPSSEHLEHFLFSMKEIWKDIKGFEGLYQVSNKGNVKSLKKVIVRKNSSILNIRERILKTRPNDSGYDLVHLSKHSKEKVFTVHRLVAETFIPNPHNLPQVNHKDEDKKNNSVDNLEWCTHKYNVNYNNASAIRRGIETKKEKYDWLEVCERGLKTKTKNGIYTRPIPINQFTWDGIFIKRFRSSEQVRRELGINAAYKVAQGLNRHAGGYIWLYDEDVDKIKERVLVKKPDKRVLQYDKNGRYIKTWESPKAVSEHFGVSLSAICSCLNGKTKTCCGYIVKYNNQK